MTKILVRTPWFWAFLAIALMVPAAHAAEVNNITMGRFQDFTVVTLYGDAPLTVTHQMVEAKDGKPNRIVVDVTGAEHALPDNNYSDLPKSSVTAIRTSQFAVSPEPVVRVVLDLAEAAAYQLKTSGRRVRIMVSLPQDPPIPLEWSARDLSTGNVYAATEPAPNATPATSPESRPDVPAVKTEPAAKPYAANMDLPAAKPTATMPKYEPASKSEPSADARPNLAQRDDRSDVERYNDVVPVPMPKERPEEEIQYDIPTPEPVTITQAPKPAEQTSPKAQKPDHDIPKPIPAEKSPAPAEDKSAMAAHQPSASDAKADAPATPVPDEGSKPVASLTTLPPPSAVPEEFVPEREKVVYHSMGRRDPFAPLIKIGAAYNAAALPDVNGLRMVGVLHDVQNSWGLFEDANGYGYILKQGDRVRNGRLAKLTKNKAFFQLTEFGWSRSVELDLEREG